ncbi:hypothetical protein [Nocardiopsis changdeensis]|uniref:hypothetical protein n=1 Tax=Nocardiopsis changdeensis TaxID=2831969 RepID=UPI00159910B9|nr:hypothetical protein HUT17_01980 [Nocardiopsis flavescens]
MLTRIVDDFGTAYVHTTVLHTITDGFVWIRNSGIDRSVPIGTAPIRLRRPLEDLPGSVRARVDLPPDPGQTWRVFSAPGPSSVAKRMLQEEADVTGPGGLMTGTGELLSRIHALPVPAEPVLASPQGPARLLRWLESGRGPHAAAHLHRVAGRVLGRRRLDLAREWCEDLARYGRDVPGALLHGAPGLGVLIPSVSSGSEGVLLTGEELAVGPAEFDLGWLAGELVEHREVVPASREEVGRLLDRLLAGYGPGPDLDAVGRYAALRVLVHVHDFCAYVGWHSSVDSHLEVVADAFDRHGAGLLDHTTGTIGTEDTRR